MIRDDARADDAALAVIRTSLPGRASRAVIDLMHRAWLSSHSRRLAIALAAQPAATRTYSLAVMTATAGLVAVVLTAFPTPVAPFVWIPPAAVLALSILVLAAKVASR